MNTFIYTLTDPRDGQIKYVGKADNPQKRYSYHLRNRNAEKTVKSFWIQSLLRQGLAPMLEILDEVAENEWAFWEQYWINQIRAWGFELKNGDDGGLGFDRLNVAIRKKISQTLSGRSTGRYIRYSQYSLDGQFIKTFPSLSEVKSELGLSENNSNIGTACKLYVSAYGFLWIREGIDFGVWFKEYKNKKKSIKLKMQKHASGLAAKYLLGKKVSVQTRQKQSLAKIGTIPWNKKSNFELTIN